MAGKGGVRVPIVTTVDTSDLVKMNSALGGLKKQVGGVGSALKSAFAITGVVTAIKGFVTAATESAVVSSRTANVLKTTGAEAWTSAQNINALATAISNKTGVDDEAIQTGANLLLTFTNIRNAGEGQAAIFDRATTAAVDLSKVFGSINGASKALGKALNNPISGLGGLSKAGIQFTASQKDTIKKLVESGHLLDAQQMILGAVEKSYSGAAAAMSTPFERFQTNLQNVQEQIGATLIPVIQQLMPVVLPVITAIGGLVSQLAVALMPILQPLITMFSGLATFISRNVSAIKDLTIVIGLSVAAFKVAGIATATYRGIMQAYAFATYQTAAGEGTLTFAQYLRAAATRVVTNATKGLNAAMAANPIGLILVAVTALIAGFVMLFKRSQHFRNFLATALPVLGKIFGGWVKGILNGIAMLVRGWVAYFSFFTGLADKILGVAAKAFGWIPGVGDAIKTARRQFNNIRETVIGAVSGAADGIDALANKINTGIIGAASGLADNVNNYGKDATIAAQKNGKQAGDAWRDGFGDGLTGGKKAPTKRVKAPRTAVKAPRTSESQGFTVAGSGGGISLSVTVNGSVVQERDLARTIRNELLVLSRRQGASPAFGV